MNIQLNRLTNIPTSQRATNSTKKGGQSQDFHSSLSRRETEAETPKKGDSSHVSKKPSQIPANIVKQPENANLSDLQHRASKITGLIMSNRLSDRFKQGDESIMQMMARIQSEITTDSIADQWQSKLEEFGVVFSLSRGNHVENCA